MKKRILESANNIANVFWNEEKDFNDVLSLLRNKDLSYKGKEISLFILNMREEKEFLYKFAPEKYEYSSDQEAVTFTNPLLDEYMIIVDNRIANNENRFRFTLAHELGHIYSGHVETENWLCRDSITAEGTDLLEIQANAFAAEFLVPMNKLKEYIFNRDVTRTTISDVAEHFKVSTDVIRYRIKDLNKNLSMQRETLDEE